MSSNNNNTQLSASIRNRQRTFNQHLPQIEPEHPLFRSATTAKIFPALSAVSEKEVAHMFGLPEIDKRKAKESYLIERSDPYKEKPGIFSRDGIRGSGNAGESSPTNNRSGSTTGSTRANMHDSLINNNINKNKNTQQGALHDQMMKNRLKRAFVVSRHGVSMGAPVSSVFAGCDFEGDERLKKRKVREQLYLSMKTKNKGNAFVVRSAAEADREISRHEYLNSVDDETMDLLKDYIFSGRAALDAAVRKRDEINGFRTNQRRQKGIRQQQQQQRLRLMRSSDEQHQQ